MGRSGLYPPPSQSPSYSEQGLGFPARQLRAPFFSLFPFSRNTLISASNCVPRTCSKIPISDLPWGGNGDRVRLVNSAEVSRGWEAFWEQRPREAAHGGDMERAPHGGSRPSFHVVSGGLFGPLPHSSSFPPLSLTVGPAPCSRWKGQPFIVGLLCASNCACT